MKIKYPYLSFRPFHSNENHKFTETIYSFIRGNNLPEKFRLAFIPRISPSRFFCGESFQVPSQASRRKFMIYVRTGLSRETLCDGYLREYKDAETVRNREIPRKEQVRRYINLAGSGGGITATLKEFH